MFKNIQTTYLGHWKEMIDLHISEKNVHWILFPSGAELNSDIHFSMHGCASSEDEVFPVLSDDLYQRLRHPYE